MRGVTSPRKHSPGRGCSVEGLISAVSHFLGGVSMWSRKIKAPLSVNVKITDVEGGNRVK